MYCNEASLLHCNTELRSGKPNYRTLPWTVHIPAICTPFGVTDMRRRRTVTSKGERILTQSKDGVASAHHVTDQATQRMVEPTNRPDERSNGQDDRLTRDMVERSDGRHETRTSYVYSESLYLLCSSCSTHVAIQLKGPRIPRNDKSTELYHRDTVSPGRNTNT